MASLEEIAAGMDMTVDELLSIVEENSPGAAEAEAHRQAAADVVREAEELLTRVRTVWGSQRPQEAHRRVFSADDLSGHERLMLAGYLDAVRLGVDVQALVDRKTERKYRRLAEDLGLDRQLRRRGPLPSA